MTEPRECNHIWIANSGKGGTPEFKIPLDGKLVMHVNCSNCTARTFFSGKRWEEMPEASDGI